MVIVIGWLPAVLYCTRTCLIYLQYKLRSISDGIGLISVPKRKSNNDCVRVCVREERECV